MRLRIRCSTTACAWGWFSPLVLGPKSMATKAYRPGLASMPSTTSKNRSASSMRAGSTAYWVTMGTLNARKTSR